MLARTHTLVAGHSSSRLLAQLTENERALFALHTLLADDVEAERPLTPAGEWLLDNFYVIEEQIRTARKHFSSKYSRELPHLQNTASAGLPRVYDISLAAIAYNDGHMDPENLRHMVAAYQSVAVLSLGELWAIPIMLRLTLLDKIRYIADRIARYRLERICANAWADQMIRIASDDPKNLILAIADMARSTPVLTSAFVAELIRRLRGQGATLALPLTWMEQRLSNDDVTIEQFVRLENQVQAANQVSMSNCIGSLRALDATNWRDFVEATSLVEQALRQDPSGTYAHMDFATRDMYRHAVEKLAKVSPASEGDVAAAAITLAQTAQHIEAEGENPLEPLRAAHVGYYLIGEGLPLLENTLGVSVPLQTKLKRCCHRHALPIYAGGAALLTALSAAVFVVPPYFGGSPLWMMIPLGMLAVVGGSHLAFAVVNWLATVLVSPRTLPRMDFSTGIPPGSCTLVVVPAMLTHTRDMEHLLMDMEVRFLANRDANLHFALLTDFGDARQEHMPQDAALLEAVRQSITALNHKYGGEDGSSFVWLHRPRRWNEQERIWMGHERKRGKLADLNALLRGGAQDRFLCIAGKIKALSNIQYVITLDTDTQLARDTARQFAGIMAHPLNRPLYDAQKQRVVAGYGLLQPRVVSSLPANNRSRFAQLCTSNMGIDPYTRATSDVYQDVFEQGSYIGKGIYDVAMFEQAVGSRFPENRILSHDLLEGCYVRSGLVSDVHLYEDSPTRYGLDALRRYRWIRGDWQIARWIWPTIPGPDGHAVPNTLSALARWKIFDNLRRSLAAPALLALLFFGWGMSSGPFLWSLAVIGLIMIPPLLQYAVALMQKSPDMTLKQHISASLRQAPRQWSQAGFSLVCLPYEALLSMDAVARTLWRTLISHRNMLEWNPSASAGLQAKTGLGASVRRMWIGPVVAVTGALLLAVNPVATTASAGVGLVLVFWLASPLLVWWMGQPRVSRRDTLSDGQHGFLRQLARKTWGFFETYAGPQDNWLPPDNHQEYPVARTAHRTSPTNMGLALLANQAAYDFGALTAGDFMERTENTLRTMSRLKRYRGHFYNWYDTQSLTPLPPLYISTVDSGNLAGHLLTLRSGLAELPAHPVLGTQLFLNLWDTLCIACDTRVPERGNAHAGGSGTMSPPLAHSLKMLRLCVRATVDNPPATLHSAHVVIMHLCEMTGEILDVYKDSALALPAACLSWLRVLDRQCRAMQDELALLCPWVGLTASQRYIEAFPELDVIPTLGSLAALHSLVFPENGQEPPQDSAQEKTAEIHLDAAEREHLRICLATANWHARDRRRRIEVLRGQCDLFSQVEYEFLYDEERRLLHIGYTVNENRPDAGYYDLLASEARLASFVGIAQGTLPQENWFALGRLLTSSGGEPILLSWSGSMFEYLMPLLVMPSFERTLLDETCKAAVSRQIAYGRQCDVPWGVSECGYNAFDAASNYQYRAFGVPGLGLKRGLAADVVIAPYASVLALMVAPAAACANLERLAALGFEGSYGMYEAVDYTASRLPHGKTCGVVRSFMAHHQGMSLLALNHLLLHAPMQRRFAADLQCQATMLLLQEKIPEVTSTYAHTSVRLEHKRAPDTQDTPLRIFGNPNTPYPEVQLLSNGQYHVMLTNAGGGYSRWRDLALTRWNEDSTRDHWGTFCYLKAMDSGEFWSTAYQPLCVPTDGFQSIFSEGRAEFFCHAHKYDAHMEVVVASEDDVELRRLRITNRSWRTRTIEITTFAEVVLAPPLADDVHPAFSKLFVQTEIVPEQRTLLCTRRQRSENDATPWMLHSVAVHAATPGEFSYETDRAAFLGRGRTAANPRAMLRTAQGDGSLSGRQGPVLDPAASIRVRLTLEPEQTVTLDMIYGAAEDRSTAMHLVNKYRERHIADRVFDMTWTHSQVLLRQLNASEADAQLYARLAGSIIYPSALLRAPGEIVAKNRRGQSGLWGYAISGDLPIALFKIENPEHMGMVRQMLQAHEYWRLKGLTVDLVIWNEDQTGYRQFLHDQIMGLIAAGNGAHLLDRPGGIFVRSVDRIADEDRILIQTVARIILSDAKGTLGEQVHRPPLKRPGSPLSALLQEPAASEPPSPPQARPDLLFFNGLGGFTPDGREYVITTAADSSRSRGQLTPAPWVNVIANPFFGTVVSESGPAYTWSENAHEFRLTPWGNDPVSDLRGEAFYLRDEERGLFWSPTPAPCRGEAPYVTRHGFGYTVFEHNVDGIYSELQIYVAMDGAIKFSALKVRNNSGRPRKLSAMGYAEWVLGDLRSKCGMHVVTEVDAESGAILARNPYNTEFSERTAFFAVDDIARRVSGDRMEFIGRNGSLDAPAALRRTRLSGRVGAALDPCAAIQVFFELAEGQEREIIFKMGVGTNMHDAKALLRRFAGARAAGEALENVWRQWAHTLGAINVDTPDPSFNMLTNGWLLYQSLSCRMWGRSATYQSGGAFGFRDQLQDAMALVHTRPDILREHVLLCASRQFPEGDVQHWWHPPLDRGVRTRCSDDYLWLPLAVCHYIRATGDTGVLDELRPFLQGRALKAEEDAYYDLPERTQETASLYAHCVAALKHGLRFGAHGLPLMGTGDWNDGMDLVGAQGKGESVWLAFFLHRALMDFCTVAEQCGDTGFAGQCRDEAGMLREHIAANAWDGEWYRRAYFDDGSPLGSANCPECRIDSIAQSWAVLSGAGEPEKTVQAMDSLYTHLMDREHRLLRLFTPPFDSSDMHPGYIKGYPPGIRENGGQYTHAAVWAGMAFATLGDSTRAWEVFNSINPINHARTPEEAAAYAVEPYVMAADVSVAPLHRGRGGWTWYTGSAAWMYRLMTESLLGLNLENNRLRFAPCVPPQWSEFKIHYRYHETIWHITMMQTCGTADEIQVFVDGAAQEEPVLVLVNDRQEHWVDVRLERLS